MPTFFDLSIFEHDVEPRPIRRLCIRADATFSELQGAIVVLTGWDAPERWWHFLITDRDYPEVDLYNRCAANDAGQLGLDPSVTPISYYLDPDELKYCSCRYYHGSEVHWRINVIARDRWEVLDDRLCWLMDAQQPWPPFEIGGPKEYKQLLDAVRTGHDPMGLVPFAKEELDWSPELDVAALEARLEEQCGHGRAS